MEVVTSQPRCQLKPVDGTLANFAVIFHSIFSPFLKISLQSTYRLHIYDYSHRHALIAVIHYNDACYL